MAAYAFPDFSNRLSLFLNGDAAAPFGVDGTALRLAPAEPDQAGSAYGARAVDAAAFSTYFRLRIADPGGVGDRDGPGADGLAFVVQANDPHSLGSIGGGLGYRGVPDSVAVEFDTYRNPEFGDPAADHVAIVREGSVAHADASDVAAVGGRLNDGDVWHAWIDYDGATMEVRLSGTGERPDAPLLSRAIDIPEVIGSSDAFVGFSAATGSGWGDHDVLAWEYREGYDPVDPGEPLFTEGGDVVDFGTVVSGTYLPGSQYDALGGDDSVTLPADPQAAAASGYDPARTFRAGAGDDTVIGGGLDDVVIAGPGGDLVLDFGGDDRLDGSRGDDRIEGGPGRDTLLGGEGNDILLGGLGDDTLDGGPGIDAADYADASLGVTVRLATGAASGDASEVGSDRLVGIEIVLGGGGDDALTGDGAVNRLAGGDGDDRLDGGRNDDTLQGQAGDDTLRGALDHDWLDGGAGLDFLRGDSGNDRLDGGDDNDRLVGSAGNDRLEGGNGADELRGESGGDVLIGGAARDQLYGGYGADTLTGGTNADRFFLTAIGESGTTASARDVITDFLVGIDDIDLSRINAVQGGGGNAAFSFIGAGEFTEAGQLRFFKDAASNRTIVEGNVNADLAADFQIELLGLHDLAAGDFVL